MNTYNDDLHSSVVKILDGLEAELQSLQAELDASVYSLYYAQGAKITAEEQFDQAQTAYDFQTKIKKQAVDCNSFAMNVNTMALDQKKYTAVSVTNTATAAADVQIATNAIIRLAGNMGSIFSIVSAADYGQDIYNQSKNAYEKMNQTAYEAEVASKLSLEASFLTAEVPYNTVADQAKGTNAAVGSILTVASKDFDNASDTLSAKNDDLAKASYIEKAAEGMVKYVNTDRNSTKKAYLLNNKELNLALQVPEDTRTSSSFVVSFNNYISPFQNVITPDGKTISSDKMTFPVDSYYLFTVKNSNQPVFSIAEAEGLVAASSNDRYVKIPAPAIRTLKPKLLRTGQTDTADLFTPKPINAKVEINIVLDSDGDRIIPGKNYVVFVLAVFDPVYQKAINNFDQYLTASSEKFALTSRLTSPDVTSISYFPPLKDKDGRKFDPFIAFALVQDPTYKVEYRAIFLPDKTNLLKSLLTENRLNKVGNEIQDYEYLLEHFISKIEELDVEINVANDDVTALNTEIKKAKDGQEKLNDRKDQIAEMIKEKGKLQKDMKKFTKEIFTMEQTSPGFFFNKNLAEKLLIPDYSVAHILTITATSEESKGGNGISDIVNAAFAKNQVFKSYRPITDDVKITESFNKVVIDLLKDTQKAFRHKLKENKAPVPDETTYTLGFVKLASDTSDNFGNLLIPSNNYLPAILSFSTDEESRDFTNSLSDFSSTTFFTCPDSN